MADPDRLKILRQQRATIAEHLAWLDREIRREAKLPQPMEGDEVPLPPQAPSTAPNLPSAPKFKPPSGPPPNSPPPASARLEANNPSPALTADPGAVLEEWTERAGSSDQPLSKSGCWLTFAAVSLLGIGGVIAIVLLFY